MKNMGSLAFKALAAVTILLVTKGGRLLNTASQIAVFYEFPQLHKFGLREISFNTRFRFVNHSRGNLKVDRLRIRVFSKSSAGAQELGTNPPNSGFTIAPDSSSIQSFLVAFPTINLGINFKEVLSNKNVQIEVTGFANGVPFKEVYPFDFGKKTKGLNGLNLALG